LRVSVKREKHGKPKLLYIDDLLDSSLKDESEKTGLTQSEVARQRLLFGDAQFRLKYRLDVAKEKEAKSDSKVDEESEDKGVRLSKEYMKKRLFDWKDGLGSGEWVPVE